MPNAAQYAARKASGICARCENARAVEGKIRCEPCSKLQIVADMRRRDKVQHRIGTRNIRTMAEVDRIESTQKFVRELMSDAK